MTELDVARHLDPEDVRGVERLLERAYQADGHRAIDEQRWADAVHGGSARFAGLVLRETRHDDLVAYGQVTGGDRSWAIDLVVDPHHRDDTSLTSRLLAAAVDVVAGEGGGQVHWWVHEPTEDHARLAALVGLAPERDLWQMRVPLPIGERTDLVTRPFEVGRDEEAWLEVNNAAFAWHPEQGGWTVDDLRSRQAEPWFDPTGFLLHERDGRLAGFCWTKLHPEPPVGEIYVIAVHPDFAGRGLGRALTVAGLDHLGRSTDIGMLYVDATNAPAVGLYEDLGFTVHATNRAFVGHVAAAQHR